MENSREGDGTITRLSKRRFPELVELGAGVWAGDDRASGLTVRVRLLEGPEGARIARDARLAAAVQHPNLERVVEVLEVEGAAFLVTEELEGETLAERIAGARGSLEEALLVGQQLAGALAALHAAGGAHRGLEPAGVVWLGHGAVKVTAVGLAPEVVDADALARGEGAWRAPEQVAGERGDAASDQFALALVLYQLIAGGAPYPRAGGEAAFARARLEVDAAPLSLALPGVPADVEQALARALAREAGARFESRAAFERALVEAHARLTGAPLVGGGPSGRALARRFVRTERRRGGPTRVYRVPGLAVDPGVVAAALGVVVLAGLYYLASVLGGTVLGGLRAMNAPAPRQADGGGSLGGAIVGGSGGVASGASSRAPGGPPPATRPPAPPATGLAGTPEEPCEPPGALSGEDAWVAYLRCRLAGWGEEGPFSTRRTRRRGSGRRSAK